ncbi:hypothetical protein GCM10011419_07080 [Vogesella fluminis]|uniref:Uncharacterized protein n=1 Tax=Vogesella fluminis TaxID=1069161 RepID=A0ABQ3H6E7_9NEIS|nr:hypothetical protein GCM10011419_07080 [Vogesella fluminis]
MLICAGNSFATGEDAPLPGDFQPPRQGKPASKTLPATGGSNKANDVPVRNIQPESAPRTEDSARKRQAQPHRDRAGLRRGKHGKALSAGRKASRQSKLATAAKRTGKVRKQLHDGKQSVRSNKVARISKKAAIRQRAVSKRTKAGKVLSSRKAGTGQRSLAARKRQKAAANTAKRGTHAKTKASRTGSKQTLKQRKARKTALTASGKRGRVAKAKRNKSSAKVRRHRQPAH